MTPAKEQAAVSRDDARLQQLFGLEGQCAVVIGGSSGIGRAVSELLLAAGARVALAGRTPARVEAAVAELQTRGGRPTGVIGMETDITQEAAVTELFDRAADVLGGVDVMVN